MEKKRISAGKRARRRLKAEIRRLKRENVRLSVHSRPGTASIRSVGMSAPPTAAMMYKSEMNAIREYVLDYPDRETGGSMYGWYSETGLPIIALVTGPGRNAMHHSVRFHADEGYSMEFGSAVVDYGLQHIGEWHSHHRMGLNYPSDIDCQAMSNSLSDANSTTKRFLCGVANIVGTEVTLNTFFFSVESGRSYSHVPIVTKRYDSPIRTGLWRLITEIERKGKLS